MQSGGCYGRPAHTDYRTSSNEPRRVARAHDRGGRESRTVPVPVDHADARWSAVARFEGTHHVAPERTGLSNDTPPRRLRHSSGVRIRRTSAGPEAEGDPEAHRGPREVTTRIQRGGRGRRYGDGVVESRHDFAPHARDGGRGEDAPDTHRNPLDPGAQRGRGPSFSPLARRGDLGDRLERLRFAPVRRAPPGAVPRGRIDRIPPVPRPIARRASRTLGSR